MMIIEFFHVGFYDDMVYTVLNYVLFVDQLEKLRSLKV